MKKVLLRAPVLTQSGYGVHARQVASWLLKRNDVTLDIQALPWGDTPWLINGDTYDGMIGKMMKRTVDVTGKKYDVTFQLQLPNEWDPSLGEFNVGLTAGVETDKCNPIWIEACNRMNAVVVPSAHSKNSLTNSGVVKSRMFVIPESYTPAVIGDEKTAIDDLKFSTSFNFLVFGQITGNNPENDRKNVFYTIRWLCETFKDDPDVGIVVKTNVGRNTCIDRKIVHQMFEALIREVRKGPYPRIHLVHGDMSDAEVASLYKHPSVKALVAATRGEGYGLPILEAATSGLPVIATRWSGHLDFMGLGKYIELDYKLQEIHPSRIDDRIFVRGSRWASPIEDDFKRKVKKFRDAHQIPKEWALQLSEKLKEKLSSQAVDSMYDQAFGEVLR